MHDPLSSIPGNELVSVGITDLAAGRETEAAMLVAMAAPRLRAVGVDVPETTITDPSHCLYGMIDSTEDKAHSYYNALIGRMVSFARTLEHARSG